MALDGLGQPQSAYCKPLRVQNAAVQVQSLLDKDAGEEWIGGWPGVGIYEGYVLSSQSKLISEAMTSYHHCNQRMCTSPHTGF